MLLETFFQGNDLKYSPFVEMRWVNVLSLDHLTKTSNNKCLLKKIFCLDRLLKLSAEGCQAVWSYFLISVLFAGTGAPLEHIWVIPIWDSSVKLNCAQGQKALDKQCLVGDSSPGNAGTGKAKQVFTAVSFLLAQTVEND